MLLKYLKIVKLPFSLSSLQMVLFIRQYLSSVYAQGIAEFRKEFKNMSKCCA